MTNHPEHANLFFPTRGDVTSLKVGDMAPDAFGRLVEVVEVSCRKEDIHGRLFVLYYTRFGGNGRMSQSFKENEVQRNVGLSRDFTSAQIDDIEKRLRAERGL